MATLTLNLATPFTHTLPAGFGMVALSSYGMSTTGDAGNLTFQRYVKDLGAESLRAHLWNNTYAANVQAGMKLIAAYLGLPTLLQVDIRPAPWPFSTLSPVNLSNLQAAPNQGSPQAAVAVGVDFIANGVNVQWMEGYNEPANNGPGNERWFTGTAFGATADVRSEVWAAVMQRAFFNEVRARLPNVKVCSGVYATNEATYGISGGRSNMRGANDLQGGFTWPYPDENFNYWDIYTSHPYPGINGGQGTGTDQSVPNSMFYTTAAIENDTAPADDPNRAKARMTAWHNAQRAWLTAKGQGAKRFGHSEFGWFLPDYRGGLADVGYAIGCARDQARWALDFITFFSANATQYTAGGYTDNVIGGNPPGTGHYIRTVRYYAQQQLALKFLRTYKKQLFNGTNVPWTVAPPLSPGGLQGNGVPALQVASGYKTDDGTALGVLVANYDMTNPQPLTLALSATPTGAGTITICDATQPNETTIPIRALPGTATITQTIPAGGFALLEIPIVPSAGFGGGGGGGGGGPVLPGSSFVGQWTGAASFTESASSPFVSQWAQALFVAAEPAVVEPPPVVLSAPTTVVPLTWKVELCDRDGVGIAVLLTTTGRRLSARLNRPAQVMFQIRSDDAKVAATYSDGYPQLDYLRRTVKVYRDELNVDGTVTSRLRFFGVVWALSDQGTEDGAVTQVSCLDPLHRLSKRQTPATYEKTNEGALILKDLVEQANLEEPTGIITDGGTFETTPAQTVSYQRKPLSEVVTDLTGAYNGFDVMLEPLDRTDGVMARLHCFARLGNLRRSVIFGWGVPPFNVAQITRDANGDRTATRMVGTGRATTGGDDPVTTVDDDAGRGDAGLLVDVASYDATDPTYLDSLVSGDLDARKLSRTLRTITPVAGKAPVPFVDFIIGDSAVVRAGPELRGGFDATDRIYGFDLDHSDEGVETLSAVYTSPQ